MANKVVERRTITYFAGTDREVVIDFTPGNHRYKVSAKGSLGEYWPSVTSINGMLAIDALPWHGQKVGVTGLTKLVEIYGVNALDLTDVPGLVKLLTLNKITVNHVLQKAGKRGDAAHAVMAEWATSQTLPSISDFEPEHQGYIKALATFLLAMQPEFVSSELLVCSPAHRYTGTLDGRVLTSKTCTLVTDWWFDEDGRLHERFDDFPPMLRMIDAKTGEADHDKPGKGIYPQHHFQLAGYKGAAVECGLADTGEELIVHLHESGRYKVARGIATPEQFHALIPAFHANKAVKAASEAALKKIGKGT